MDLLGWGRKWRSNWTVEDIQSDEPEDALVQLTVFGDELPFHKPHVGLKGDFIREP